MTISFDRRTRSQWMDIDVAPDARDLEGNRSCDTIVIGSGIAGMSTVYELAMEGQKVIVVDRGAIAGGITARTTAHLAPLCDDLTSAMIKLRGEDISRGSRPDRTDTAVGKNRVRFSPTGWLPFPGSGYGPR